MTALRKPSTSAILTCPVPSAVYGLNIFRSHDCTEARASCGPSTVRHNTGKSHQIFASRADIGDAHSIQGPIIQVISCFHIRPECMFCLMWPISPIDSPLVLSPHDHCGYLYMTGPGDFPSTIRRSYPAYFRLAPK